ncbi:MAG: hypothetical protein LKCHEGNO_01189 [Burkholderiaceae bacterium]|nr:hypothetical protein [Burkholderiaceae bacterium]
MINDSMALCRSRGGRHSVATLAVVASLCTAFCAVANPAEDAQTGRQIFQTKCAACHTVGGGDLIGPDLKGVTAQRPREWLERWIAAPDEMLAKGDPLATALLHRFRDVPMPNLHLSAGEVTAVLDFLANGATGAPALAPGVPAVAAGNPEIGKDLFIGTARFRNGGPPCMACHSAAGIGALGGGQLGPDLTTVVQRFGGAAALGVFVGSSPTPTMNAIWQRTPLTAGERADVVAFLAQASVSQRPMQAIWQLAGLSVLGLAVLLAIAGLTWRRRLRDGVRRPMIAGRRSTGG